MKRFVVLFLIASLLLAGSAAADVDLSGMTFDQLVTLREKLNIAIWNSQEWQEVTVPAGIYQVGVDIPAGHWSIRVAGTQDICNVAYFDKLDEMGKSVGFGSQLFSQIIASPGLSAFGEVNAETVDIDMKNGWYFTCASAVIFTPYAGKPDLGFK